MSDRVIHPSNDKGKQPIHPRRSQSVSHGSGENCNTAVQVQTQLSLGSAKQDTEVEAVGLKISDNSQAKGSRSRSEIHGRPGSMDSLTLSLSHGSGSDSMLKHDMQVSNFQPTQNIGHATRSDTLLSLAPPSTETSYTDSHIKHGISQYPQGPVNSQMVFGNSFVFLPPNFGCTISHNLSPTVHSGTIAAAPSFLCSMKENVNRLTPTMSSKRNLLAQSQSVLAHAKYIGNAVVSNHHPPAFYGGQYRTMHNHSGNVFVSNHHPPALTEEQYKTMLNHSGINMFQSRDAFMMRLRTAVENFEPSLIANDVFAYNHHPPASEEPHKRMHDANACTSTKRMRTRAEKTCTLRITKSTDSKESPNSRGSKVLSPVISYSEGKDDVQEVKATGVASKKKSSAKRDGMDKNKTKKNHLSGVASSSSKKNAMADTYMPNKDAITSAGEEVGQKRKLPSPEIPDMDIDKSDLREATSSEKINRIGGKTKEGEIINSEPVPKSTGKEPMVIDQQTTPVRTSDPSSTNNVGKSEVTACLEMWTGRWRHNPAKTPEKKPEAVVVEAVVVGDPQRVKVKSDKEEEKPFASVAAMALMGRVLRDSHGCQFINKGAVTAWMDKKA